MIWRFAFCVVPTSVASGMILRDTQRPVYTRKQSLLLTKPPNMRSDLNNDTICCLICAKQNQDKDCFEFNPSDSVLRAAKKSVLTYQSNISSCNNKFVYNECVFMYHFTLNCFIIIQLQGTILCV